MTVMNEWWLRVITMFLSTVLCVVALAFLLGDSEYTYVVLLFCLVALVLGIELARPGGSVMSSGLGISGAILRHVGFGLGVSVVSLGIIGGVAVAMGARFTLVSDQHESIVSELHLTSVILIASASVSEELFFRGTIFEAIRERFKPIAALVVTSVLFGVAHSMNPGMSFMAILNVTLAGTLMGFMVHRSSSLWMPMAFHASWNIMTRAFFGKVSGTDGDAFVSVLDTSTMDPNLVWFIDGPFGIEQGLLTSVLLVGATAATIYFVRKDRAVIAARERRDRTTLPI